MNQKQTKTRVAVVFGGRSGEHEVSIISGQNIINGLDKNKYDVIAIGITKSGKWLMGKNTVESFKKGDYSGLTEVILNCESGTKELLHFKNNHVEKLKIDIFFPALHGPFGEDGTIQGLFEIANVPYTGCGVLASSVGMDKLITKALWEQGGLPVVPYIGIGKNSWKENSKQIMDRIEKELGFPVFIKPANMGSSVGISKVKNKAGLKKAIDLACEFDTRILIEKGVNARELETAVLGNSEPKAARVGEILVGGEFYDYNDKYVNGVSSTQVPAKISSSLEKKILEMALKAYKLLDGSGLARIDMFLDRDSNKIYLNEINTMPGFTSISMYPKMWQASGISYTKLLDEIVKFGFDKYKEKQEKKISFDEAGDWFSK